MNINCSGCGAAMSKAGALLFGPPNDFGQCIKEHFCHACKEIIDKTIVRLQNQAHGVYI